MSCILGNCRILEADVSEGEDAFDGWPEDDLPSMHGSEEDRSDASLGPDDGMVGAACCLCPVLYGGGLSLPLLYQPTLQVDCWHGFPCCPDPDLSP